MIHPTAFTIFGLDVKWYAISYIVSMIIADFMLNHYINQEKNSEITIEEKDNVMFFSFIGLLIGARIGVFIFYWPNELFTKEIFNIRAGGMSFHGGLIGVIIAVMIYAKNNNKDAIKIGDLLVLPAPIGLFLGRIANYINQDIKGIDFFHLKKNIALYEAFFEGLVLFFIIQYKKDLKKRGKNICFFMFFYGFLRFFIEFLKENEGPLKYNIAQLLCVLMVLYSIYLYNFIEKSPPNKIQKL